LYCAPAPPKCHYEDADYDAYGCKSSCGSLKCRKQPSDYNKKGNIYGGGHVETPKEKLTHKFKLHCDKSKPQSLEVSWGKHKFTLNSLADCLCSLKIPRIGDLELNPIYGLGLDKPVIDTTYPFDTYEGSGQGDCDGQPASIYFSFTDVGDAGSSDNFSCRIVAKDGHDLLDTGGHLRHGNHQAYNDDDD
jgi:hypothetical protein